MATSFLGAGEPHPRTLLCRFLTLRSCIPSDSPSTALGLAAADSLPPLSCPLSGIPPTHVLPLFSLFVSVISRYSDIESTEALSATMEALVPCDPEGKVIERWRRWISDEVTRCFGPSSRSVAPCLSGFRSLLTLALPSPHRSATAPTSHLTLILHLVAFISAQASTIVDSPQWPSTVSLLAVALDGILDPASGSRPPIKKAAERRVRKLFRTVGILSFLRSVLSTELILPSAECLAAWPYPRRGFCHSLIPLDHRSSGPSPYRTRRRRLPPLPWSRRERQGHHRRPR